MLYKVFIQSNDEQYIGALVAAYALKRNSQHADKFDVEIMNYKDFPWLNRHIGEKFLRGAEHRVWDPDDLQSFTPLRFMPPKLMNYEGRSIVIDPDCFALGDVWDLFSRDMQGKAILCRIRPGFKDLASYRASSVMLLDNAKLKHWDAERTFDELFQFKTDYMKWIKLEYEADETIGELEEYWNDFDRLTPNTKILHNTYRRTQPWKTGLPISYTVRVKPGSTKLARSMIKSIKSWLNIGKSNFYQPHPDLNQEKLFFDLLRECLEQGIVTEAMIQREMASNHMRHDALAICRRLAA